MDSRVVMTPIIFNGKHIGTLFQLPWHEGSLYDFLKGGERNAQTEREGPQGQERNEVK